MMAALLENPIRTYFLLVLCSAAICAFLYGWRLKKLCGKGWICALLTLVTGLVLGTVCSRLTFILCRIRHVVSLGLFRQLFSDDITLWCFSGGAIGAILAVELCAKLVHLEPHKARACFAPVGALMVAFARFSEYFLIEDQIGVGPYIENEALHFFPITVCIPEWEEYYLAVFLLEGLTALAVALVSRFRLRDYTFQRTLYWLCLPQIFWQSLLNQNIMWWFFLKVEQLFCVLLCLGMTLYGYRKSKDLRPFWMGLAATAVIAFAEFALDKITVIPMPVTYGIMAAALVLMGAGGRMCFASQMKAQPATGE